MLESIIQWLEAHMQPCFYKRNFGIECPGCGMQRAFVALLRGQFWESLKLYPALIPTLGMVLFLILHLIFKFKNGANILKYLFIANTTIVVVSYIIKLIT